MLKNIFNNKKLLKEIFIFIGVCWAYVILSSFSFNILDTSKQDSFINILSGNKEGLRLFQFNLFPFIISSLIFYLVSWIIPETKMNNKEGFVGQQKNKQIIIYASYTITFFLSIYITFTAIQENLFYPKYQNFGGYFLLFSILAIPTILLIGFANYINKYSLISGTSTVIFANYLNIIPTKYNDFKHIWNTTTLSTNNNSNYIIAITILIILTIVYNTDIRRICIDFPNRNVIHKKYANKDVHIPMKTNTYGMFAILLATYLFPIFDIYCQNANINNNLNSLLKNFIIFMISFIFSFSRTNAKSISNMILKINGKLKNSEDNSKLRFKIYFTVFINSIYSSTLLLFIFLLCEYISNFFAVESGMNLASMVIVFSNIIIDVYKNIKNNLYIAKIK